MSIIASKDVQKLVKKFNNYTRRSNLSDKKARDAFAEIEINRHRESTLKWDEKAEKVETQLNSLGWERWGDKWSPK